MKAFCFPGNWGEVVGPERGLAAWDARAPGRTTALLSVALCIARGREAAMGTVAVPSPKTLFPAMGLVAPCQAEPSPASPHALVMKGSRHSVPDPAVGRGRAQESRADSSDKELLFLRRGLGNIPDCLFVPGVSLYRRRWAESRAAAPHGHPGVRGGETPPPPPPHFPAWLQANTMPGLSFRHDGEFAPRR